ncbi:MAG: quinolinate synthase NadA [Oscillospiraceae bacterium]|nr:quinolinate synthase NadA [Oscillospiraceae bacterium]
MTIHELQNAIRNLKQERNICLLAHSYQAREIIEVADYSGDSYALSVAATKATQSTVIMCGVRFMAETVKILSPEKTVYLANGEAGCPMAEQMEPELISAVKQKYPDYTVVAYINTTAELKAISDVCVTSSSAVSIVRKLENPNILFIPDCNLGDYVAKQIPEKNVKLLQGGCPIHACVDMRDVEKAKKKNPNALLLIHPECLPSVVAAADFVGSTSAIMEYAKNSPEREFIIGTEMSIAEHLQYACPDKRFYVLSQKLLCPNMKITTLVDLYHSLSGKGGEEIVLPQDLIRDARKCIDEMIRLG